MKQLSDKQQRFIELYNGNAKDTAIAAGYSDPGNAGYRCMQNADICRLIQERTKAEIHSDIADRQRLQKRWTEMAFNDELKPMEQLKASEHLAKSLGLFLDKTEHSGSVNFNVPPAITVIFTDEK